MAGTDIVMKKPVSYTHLDVYKRQYMNSTVVLVGLPYTLSTLLLFDFALLCLAVFFSVHYLFVYYIFQPYNEQFDMKNPFMSIQMCIRDSGYAYYDNRAGQRAL